MGQKGGLKRVVLDTNVLVSALLFGGSTQELVPLWQEGVLVLLASKEIIREYTRVLAYPKFRLTESEVETILQELLPCIEPVRAEPIPPVIREDPSDDHFLACALSGHADAVISGDRHLLTLHVFRGIPILTVKECLLRLA